jgi:hypothetical protein
MIDLKLARLAYDPKHQDSTADVIGYAALLPEVIPFLEPDWFELEIISDERYPARAAGNDMILDCMLSAGRDLIGNLCRRWRFRDPRRFGGDVKKDRPRQMHS